MFAFILRRIGQAVPTLFVIMAASFFLMHSVPGGPFDAERVPTPEIRANLEKKYHLDQPLPQQFGHYLMDLSRGDFGPSFKYKDWTVNQLIWDGLPVSATLGASAMIVSLFFGILLGSFAAIKQNTLVDYCVMTLSLIGMSIPNFVTAPLFILVFAVFLHWLPAGDWGHGDITHLIMPVTAMSLPAIATIARVMRSSMIEVLSSNFIRTARAKGLSEWTIMMRHALRPAILPVISIAGPMTAFMLTGSVVIEQVFSLPGVGRYFVQGATNRDYTLVMGVVIISSVLIIIFNLLTDILYAWIDPRIKYE